MRATKIRRKSGCGQSSNVIEIDDIYLTGCSEDGFYKKAVVHDYLDKNPGTIQVNIYPYPDCIPAVSANNEKYVRSVPNNTERDNLLNLPRV